MRGDQEVVADDLHAIADRLGNRGHAGDVVFRDRILDRHDRVARYPAENDVDPLAGVVGVLRQTRRVASIDAKLRGCDVQRDQHFAIAVTGGVDGTREHRDRVFIAVEFRPPAALVGHAVAPSRRGHQFAGDAVHLGDHDQRFVEGLRADWHYQQVLHVYPAPGMCTAAEDLDLRKRQPHFTPIA